MKCKKCQMVYSDMLDACPKCGAQAGTEDSAESVPAPLDEDLTVFADGQWESVSNPGSAVSESDAEMTVYAPESSGSAAGEDIARYRIEKEIGRGGFGSVLLASDTNVFNRKVAIKRIAIEDVGFDSRNSMARKQAVDRFLSEARTLSHLQHPNIVYIYDTLSGADDLQIVMEYVEGDP